ncbi:MAG: hypothetical protein GY811_03175 [Myxococcales bacterium]|nr:hypothetical protein [Myxococcales bacterium]
MAGRADDPAVPQRFSGGGRKGLKTYVRDDGSIVRDHRGGTSEPNLTSRESQPRDSSKVQPATLRSVRLALRPAMKKCIQEHAADADGAPKAQAVLTVSIKDELLRVDKLDFQSEGLAPEAEEHLKNCATTAMIGHEQPIGGSPEVAEHVMIFPYDL